jgi:hypothetical protein
LGIVLNSKQHAPHLTIQTRFLGETIFILDNNSNMQILLFASKLDCVIAFQDQEAKCNLPLQSLVFNVVCGEGNEAMMKFLNISVKWSGVYVGSLIE